MTRATPCLFAARAEVLGRDLLASGKSSSLGHSVDEEVGHVRSLERAIDAGTALEVAAHELDT